MKVTEKFNDQGLKIEDLVEQYLKLFYQNFCDKHE